MRRRLGTALVIGSALFFGSHAAMAQMSEGEKKASARAAFAEGVELQDKGKPADALRRFETAESLFDAPTHLLHIAECQALTGKLVEAQETYSTLDKKELPAGSPDVFKQAQTQGRAELQVLKPRIPTLRVVVHPDPQTLQGLVVTLNDQTIPGNVAVVARPVNPGPYRISASATGYATSSPQSFNLAEKELKTVELTLVQGAIGAAATPPTVTTQPAPYMPAGPSQPPPPYEDPGRLARPKPTTTGLLLGAKLAAVVPGGSVYSGKNFGDYTGAGAGFGLDAQLRFARILLAGLTYEWATLGSADPKAAVTNQIPTGGHLDYATHLNYFGATFGIVPNIDHLSFIGTVGLGYRLLAHTTTLTTAVGRTGSLDESFGGAELALDVGLSIPLGPIRLVPKVGIAVGNFTKADCGTGRVVAGASSVDLGSGSCARDDNSAHAIFTVGLGVYYSLDLGKKKLSASLAPISPVASNGR